MTKEKEASFPAQELAPISDVAVVSSSSIMPDPAPSVNSAEESSSKKKTKALKHNVLSVEQRVRQAAFKFYGEQLPLGEDDFEAAVRALDPKTYQVLAIKHDRDEYSDGVWDIATEKPHWHVIVRTVDKNRRFRVAWMLEQLHIVYRKGLDDLLMANHGIETVGNFAGYAVYLTHDTPEAEKDAKTKYDIADIKSNLSLECVEQVRQGYVNPSEKRKFTSEELRKLDKEAYNLGLELGNFENWYRDFDYELRNKTGMRIIRESYEAGIKKRVKSKRFVLRCSIYIEGDKNMGKTTCAEEALKLIGLTDDEIFIPADGPGKFDDLNATHKAIVLDDMPCPNLLQMSDDRICFPYKRQKGCPPWAGQYLIITSNKPFNNYIAECGNFNKKNIEALHSRFYICSVSELNMLHEHHKQLAPFEYNTRGKKERQLERYELFKKFRTEFDRLIYDYDTDNEKVDFREHEKEYFLEYQSFVWKKKAEALASAPLDAVFDTLLDEPAEPETDELELDFDPDEPLFYEIVKYQKGEIVKYQRGDIVLYKGGLK